MKGSDLVRTITPAAAASIARKQKNGQPPPQRASTALARHHHYVDTLVDCKYALGLFRSYEIYRQSHEESPKTE